MAIPHCTTSKMSGRQRRTTLHNLLHNLPARKALKTWGNETSSEIPVAGCTTCTTFFLISLPVLQVPVSKGVIQLMCKSHLVKQTGCAGTLSQFAARCREKVVQVVQSPLGGTPKTQAWRIE